MSCIDDIFYNLEELTCLEKSKIDLLLSICHIKAMAFTLIIETHSGITSGSFVVLSGEEVFHLINKHFWLKRLTNIIVHSRGQTVLFIAG